MISVIIDSGVSVNVLDSVIFGKLVEDRFVFRRFILKIYSYGSETSFFVKGIFSVNVLTFNFYIRVDFVVVKNFNVGFLLGKKMVKVLGLFRVGFE